MEDSNLHYLQIYLPDGRTWSQFGVGYQGFSQCEAVWKKISAYLPPGSRADAFNGKEVFLKYAVVNEKQEGSS